MRTEILIALAVGALFFFASLIMSALAIKYATSSRLWDAIFIAGIAGMICSVATLALFVNSQNKGLPILWPALLTNLGICLVVAGIGWQVSSIAVPRAEKAPSAPDKALTIQLLWRTDFNVGSYKMLQMFSTYLYTRDAKRFGPFDFGVGMYGSFDSQSLFMSLYVPGSTHGYDLISWFSVGYSIYLDDARKNFHIWTAPQGDHSQPISDNLIFTNRIYIYYENILPDSRINELTNLYRSKGLEPIFRGFGYLENKRLKIAAGQEKMPSDLSLQSTPLEGFSLPSIEHSPQFIDGQKLPSLLSLFMTDFKAIGGMAAAWTDVTLSNGSKERVQFRVYNDFQKNVRFIAYYVPPSTSATTFAIVKFLAPLYADQMNDLTKRVGSAKKSEQVSARAAAAMNFPFSGIIYVYIEDSLSDAQIEDLKKLYKDHGATVEFRGFGYVIETWNQIKAGTSIMPPEYHLTDEFPQSIIDGTKH